MIHFIIPLKGTPQTLVDSCINSIEDSIRFSENPNEFDIILHETVVKDVSYNFNYPRNVKIIREFNDIKLLKSRFNVIRDSNFEKDDYIVNIDSDDGIGSNFCKSLLKCIKDHPNKDMYFSNFKTINENYTRNLLTGSIKSYGEFFNYNWNLSGKVFRVGLFDKVLDKVKDYDLFWKEDYVFCLIMMRYVKSIQHFDGESLYYVRTKKSQAEKESEHVNADLGKRTKFLIEFKQLYQRVINDFYAGMKLSLQDGPAESMIVNMSINDGKLLLVNNFKYSDGKSTQTIMEYDSVKLKRAFMIVFNRARIKRVKNLIVKFMNKTFEGTPDKVLKLLKEEVNV